MAVIAGMLLMQWSAQRKPLAQRGLTCRSGSSGGLPGTLGAALGAVAGLPTLAADVAELAGVGQASISGVEPVAHSRPIGLGSRALTGSLRGGGGSTGLEGAARPANG